MLVSRSVRRGLTAGVFCAVATAAAPGAAQAGVALVRAERGVWVSNNLSNPYPAEEHYTREYGLFDQTLTAHSDGGDRYPSDFADSTASQRSSVGEDRMTASGFIDILNVDENNGAATRFSVVFDVYDEPTPFRLTYAMDAIGFYGFAGMTEQGRVELRRVAPSSGPSVVGPDLFALHGVYDVNPEHGPRGHLAFDGGGTLPTGRYEVLLNITAPFDDFGESADIRGEYALDLRLGDAATGGPQPIPLPPAALAGGAVLAGLGAFRGARRLRRRA